MTSAHTFYMPLKHRYFECVSLFVCWPHIPSFCLPSDMRYLWRTDILNRLVSFNDLEHSQYHNVQHLIRFQAAFGGPLEDEYGYEICSIRCTKLQENWWRACSICWTACEYARLPIQLLFRCVMELFTLCNLKAARRRFISLNIGVCVAHVQLCKLKCFEKLTNVADPSYPFWIWSFWPDLAISPGLAKYLPL